MSGSLVEQLGAALDPVSAAAAPLVGDAWREVPAYTLFFAAVFAAALLFWVSSRAAVAAPDQLALQAAWVRLCTCGTASSAGVAGGEPGG